MRGLISGLLAHSMARDQSLACEQVSLRNQVKHIVATHDHPRAGGEIVAGDLVDVWADRVLVRQVLDNLIGNALKYVEAGTVPRVVVEAEAATEGWAFIRVRDNGIGVPVPQRSASSRASTRGGRGLPRHRPGPGDLPADHPAARRQHPRHRQPRRRRQLLRVHPAHHARGVRAGQGGRPHVGTRPERIRSAPAPGTRPTPDAGRRRSRPASPPRGRRPASTGSCCGPRVLR